MTPTAPNSKLSDPRIISPYVKVIYPSQNTEKDLSVPADPTPLPAPQILPTVTDPAPVTTTESTVAPTVTGTTQQATTAPNVVETKKVSNWIDTLKDHTGLFITVALISVCIGIFIGKKL